MGLKDMGSLREHCPCIDREPSTSENSIESSKSEKKSADSSGTETQERAQWGSSTEFMLTCIGYSVGLGNVWRFPYRCYKSGGGAFLIPYAIMIIMIGIPLLFMEYSFGQYFGIGSLSIFKKVCPMFQGIGIGYVVVNALVCIYYNVIIAFTLYYLIGSFQKYLPWAKCGQEWNTELCGETGDNSTVNIPGCSDITESLGNTTTVIPRIYNESYCNYLQNQSLVDDTVKRYSPSDEYYRIKLLEIEGHDIENLGPIRWHLCLCLLLAWILVVLFVSRGIKSTGKVAYFTATFPYVMLTVLVVRGVTLEGAAEGILYFVKPTWSKLLEPEVWYGAATQLFYSTNLAWGGMITMASYNPKDHKCFRDAVVINIVSFLTSLYAGFAVFSIIGHMAVKSNKKIEDVITSGPGLAFVVYPEALSLMPLPQLWSALFFFMLFLLGIGSQMVLIETVVTGFVDEFPRLGLNAKVRFLTTISVAVLFFVLAIPQTTKMVQAETILTGIVDRWKFLAKSWKSRLCTVIIVCTIGLLSGLPCTTKMVDIETVMTGLMDEFPQYRKYRFVFLLAVAGIMFLVGIPMVTKGGMYVLELMDHYSAGLNVLIIAVIECVVINWIYGNAKFASHVKEMLGFYPGWWWRMCWKFISPAIIFAILIFSFIKYKRVRYNNVQYPAWADLVGWCLVLASLVPIVAIAVYKLCTADGDTWREKWANATRSQLTGPCSIEEVQEVKKELNTFGDDTDVESPMLKNVQPEINDSDVHYPHLPNSNNTTSDSQI